MQFVICGVDAPAGDIGKVAPDIHKHRRQYLLQIVGGAVANRRQNYK